MNIVSERTEFGHRFQVEELSEPVRRGATLRTHRLWDNGSPAFGWQWHVSKRNAEAAMEYLLRSSYVGRIAWLEQRVHELESRLP